MLKVGDKVKVKNFYEIKDTNCIPDEEVKGACGQEFTIKEVKGKSSNLYYRFKEFDWNWAENMLVLTIEKPEKPKDARYKFRDDKIDLDQVCADSIEDNMKAFLVVGDGEAIVGVLPAYFQTATEKLFCEMRNKQGRFPYILYDISLSDIGYWRKKLFQYSKDYNTWRKELNDSIKDRDREKVNPQSFTVMGF